MNNLLFLGLSLALLSGCTKKALIKTPEKIEISHDKKSALELFKEGAELLWQDNQKALEKFDKAIKYDQSFVPAYFNAALAEESLGHDKKAHAYYERCLLVNKQEASCFENLIVLKARLKQEEEALALLNTYEGLFPEANFINVARAKLAFVMGDLKEAEKYARKAIESDAENVEALYVAARVFYEHKSDAAAKWVIKNALEHAPSHGGLYLLLGHINERLGLMLEALESYALATKYYPSEEALESYALLLLRQARVSESVDIFKRLSKQWPDAYRHWLHLGNASMAAKNFAEAKIAYMQAQKLNPDDRDVDFNLGLLYLDFKPDDMSDLERYKASESYFKRYLEQPGLRIERSKEVKEYLKSLARKIEIAESATKPVLDEVEEIENAPEAE